MRDDEKLTCVQGKEADWESCVNNNQDGYGNCCIVAAAKVGAALDAGKSIKEAHDEMYGMDLTGFMAGVVAQMISECHPRGEEFRRWWNSDKQIGTEGDKANDSGGVLNPALLNIKTGSDAQS